MSSRILPGLRRAAPELSKYFFVCHRCRALSKAGAPLRPSLKSKFFQSATRFSSTTAPGGLLSNIENAASLSQSISDLKTAAGSSFPAVSSKSVAYWLLGSAASVFGLVVFGGLTRLTESGLSITEWRPVTGSLPPMSDADWESEFRKYQSSPEYKQLNPNMDLAEFKKIYFMEWTHRLWGRVVGLTFALPAAYFVARKKASVNVSWRLLGITGLIGVQGVIGWWMVASGLTDDLFAPGAHPRVSHYRLATHLGTAFITYSSMLLTGLQILREHALLADPEKAMQKLHSLRQFPVFRKLVAALAVLVFTTVMSGALVAGLDAGLIWNEWPTMGGGFNPPKEELFKRFYCRKEDASDMFWRNMLENPSTVQLNHRSMAYVTTIAVLAVFAYSRFGSKGKALALPSDAMRSMKGVVHLVALQVTLGITTLLYLVPVHLAATHQAGSLLLLSGVLMLGNRVWWSKRVLRLVEGRMKNLKRQNGTSGPIHPAMRPNLSAAKAAKPVTSL